MSGNGSKTWERTLLGGIASLHADPDHLILRAPRPLAVLSSAFSGGGWREADTIVNRHVNKGYDEADPVAETAAWLRKRGCEPETAVALMTAAWTEQAAVAEERAEEAGVAAVVTAGVSNAARAGVHGPVYRRCPGAGTINTILLVDGEMTPAAMVNAVITATEAKTAALQDLGAVDALGRVATGTTTDAVVVAATQERHGGFGHKYAGTASPLGRLAGLAVYQATREALLRSGSLKGQVWST